MTSGNETINTVTRVRRPPVQASTLVRSDASHTFDAFVRTIGAWWPVDPFSAGRQRVRDVTVERAAGGRVYETWDDETTVDWGEVVAWDPPERFAMSWLGTPLPTEVELRFIPLGSNLTRVSLEHRGWEALSDEQLAEDCALPGGYTGGAYDTGWRTILDAFAHAVDDVGRNHVRQITDEYMVEMRAKTKAYTFMLLDQGPAWDLPNRDAIIWDHGRRNFALRAEGVLAIVCPIADDTTYCGIGIFNASVEETARIMEGDPGVQAGVFTYRLHPVRSFPGDRLPA